MVQALSRGRQSALKIRAITFPFHGVVAPADHFNKQEINKNMKEDACKQGQLEEPQASLIV